MGWRAIDLTSLASAPLAVLAPSGYAYEAEGTKHVVYQGFDKSNGDKQIHELWSAGQNVWNHTPLFKDIDANPASGPPSGYTFAGEGTQHAIYMGDTSSPSDDGNIYEVYWSSGDKTPNNLTVAANLKPSVSPPKGYDLNGQVIVFEGRDGHVWVAERGTTGDWKSYDLTSRYHVPVVAAPPPTAFKQVDPVTKHTFVNILFASADGDVHRFLGSGDAWSYENITKNAVRAPPASDSPSGFADQEGVVFVSYRSPDQNIYLLKNATTGVSGPWGEPGRLTGIEGAPLAASGTVPTGYLFPYDDTLHIDYVDVNGQINELWSSNGIEWHWNPLTQHYGGLPPVTVLSAYTFAKDNSQHVVYTANNHHIWEFEWTPGVLVHPKR